MAKGISLHIGLNRVACWHYSGWSGKLNACEADAEDMHQLAGSQGYQASILKTSKATRKNVIQGIQAAAQACDRGDIFLLTYSGHGGQVPDSNHDEDDHVDETWVLYDGEMIDDELFNLWSQFKEGVRIFVLSDSCHSGTVIKAVDRKDPTLSRFDGIRYRFMPHDVAVKTYRRHEDRYRLISEALPSTQAPILASVLLISGCQDDEYSMDGVNNGLFTGTLLNVWNQGQFAGDYSAFHQTITDNIPDYYNQNPNYFKVGTPDPAFEGQKPFTIA
ncbi:MAG: caspase family protein [Anaerolineales bacterium]|nr:caspase family protein [Anaerolineales bacterium]